MFEGGHRVPFIASWPETIPGINNGAETLMTMDLLPTFANLGGAHLPVDRDMDGMDIMPILKGHPSDVHRDLHWQSGDARAVRSGSWKLIRQHTFQNWSVEQWRLHRWAYCRLTERVDREIGQVLQALREAGLEEKTLVVLTSDHGDMDGSHRLEHKSMFFEEAARVPFIVSLKGVTKPGLVDNQHLVSSGLDLIPTLCDFAGIKPPAGAAGAQRAGVGGGPRGTGVAALRCL